MRLPFTLDDMRSRGFTVVSGEEASRKNLHPSPWDIPTEGLWLIRPALDKGRWDFPEGDPFSNESELCWRSAVIDPELTAISLGMVKFHNFHEPGAEPLDRIISDSMSRGDAILTAKLDGTLIIRSVWNGRVVFRTRNSFFLGPFEPQVRNLVEERHPILLDPDWLPHLHLHFEFVSPRNLIIIRYPLDDMILIHAREGHRMASWEELEDISRRGCLHLVEDLMMGISDPTSLQYRVTEMERLGQWDHEGIVIRDPRTGTMAKIKGDEYISKYRMKFHFSWDDFVSACLSSNASSEEDARATLATMGVDWELLPDVGRWWEILDERMGRCQKAMRWASATVRRWRIENPSPTDQREDRKAFAEMVRSSSPSPMAMSISFLILDGKREEGDILLDLILKETRAPIGQDAIRGKTFSLEGE